MKRRKENEKEAGVGPLKLILGLF